MKTNVVARWKIAKRIRGIESWLKKNGRRCQEQQLHLEKNTTERIYWHYGYMVALMDILRLIESEGVHKN
ncbi:MAG: hypothetical protein WBW16_09185 [Bacteroidota bacterium]